MKAAGVQRVFARAKKQISDIFRATDFVVRLGEQHFFRTRTDRMHFAHANIGDEVTERPPFVSGGVVTIGA
jgi:hypothetical protein